MKELKYNNVINEIATDLKNNFNKKIFINEINPTNKKILKSFEGNLVKLYDNVFSVDVFYKSYHFIKTFSYNKIITNELTYYFE